MTLPKIDEELLQQTEQLNKSIQQLHSQEQRVVDLIASVNHTGLRFKTGEKVFDSDKSQNTEESISSSSQD